MTTSDDNHAKTLAMLQPGNKVRQYFSQGNVNNQLMHIRAIVDGDMIVYKVWSRRKQYWVYDVTSIYRFDLLNEGGYLSLVS